jgi:hypothetical protein
MKVTVTYDTVDTLAIRDHQCLAKGKDDKALQVEASALPNVTRSNRCEGPLSQHS